MSLYFKLFEVTSHNDVEIHIEHTVKEVLYLSDASAMILSEWFYNKNGRVLQKHFDERGHYVTCDGDDLLDIIKTLKKILTTADNTKKDLLSLNYFPTTYKSSYYVSGVGIFTKEYYNILELIYKELSQLIPSDSISNRERLFLYNISW